MLTTFGLIYYFDSQSNAWPSVPGEVVVSEARPGEGGPVLRFEYVYNVEGRTFRGSHVSNALVGWGEPKPGEVVRKYPPGSKVLVHYNPRDPRKTILEPGASGWTLVGMALGVLATFYGLNAYFTRSMEEISAQERWHGRYG
jgi:hypothetical protein